MLCVRKLGKLKARLWESKLDSDEHNETLRKRKLGFQACLFSSSSEHNDAAITLTLGAKLSMPRADIPSRTPSLLMMFSFRAYSRFGLVVKCINIQDE